MKEPTHKSLLEGLKSRVTLWMVVAFLAIGSNILLVILAMSLNRPEKTIIVPPEVRQSFWVEGNKVAPEYLLDMAKYFTADLLTYNPESAQGQFDSVLKYVDPQLNSVLRRQLYTELDEIRSKQMASVYWIKQIKAKGNTVLLFGTKRNMMAGAFLGDTLKGYQIDFTFKNRLYVSGFKEIPMPVGGIEEYERMLSMAQPGQTAEGQ